MRSENDRQLTRSSRRSLPSGNVWNAQCIGLTQSPEITTDPS
ncbi:Uncharacterised protein [Vibrio cholerae]|nr:Uncharacterised protein [Vibrio cholerae]